MSATACLELHRQFNKNLVCLLLQLFLYFTLSYLEQSFIEQNSFYENVKMTYVSGGASLSSEALYSGIL